MKRLLQAVGLFIIPLTVLVGAAWTPVVSVSPHTLEFSSDSSAAKRTLRGHCREPLTGPVKGSAWTWTVREPEVLEAITSHKSAVTLTPLSTGTSYVVGTCAGGSDSAFVTVAESCNGVGIALGDDWQAKVNANPAGTTFCIEVGTHLNQSVTPKAGNTFIGETGVVMDGTNETGRAFYAPGGDPDDVTIQNMHITRYNPGYAFAVVEVGNSGADSPSSFPTGWLLEDVEISYSETGTGIFMGNNTICRRCNLHHNDVQNLVAKGNGGLFEDGELAYGNYRVLNDWGQTGGGTKIVLTDGFTFRGTYSHHNHGPGLWADIDNINTLYEDNVVEDNFAAGIFHEISWAAVIRNNQVRRNGFGWLGYVWGAGIQIAASKDVEVYGNTLEGNKMGIIGVQQDRGSGLFGLHEIRNLNVHDNTVDMEPEAQTGAAHGSGDPMTGWGIQFEDNDYTVRSTGQTSFACDNAAQTFAHWQGTCGYDLTGSLTVTP